MLGLVQCWGWNLFQCRELVQCWNLLRRRELLQYREMFQCWDWFNVGAGSGLELVSVPGAGSMLEPASAPGAVSVLSAFSVPGAAVGGLVPEADDHGAVVVPGEDEGGFAGDVQGQDMAGLALDDEAVQGVD